VGQGDSELIVTDTAAVLIDAGEQSAADDILADLQQYGITKLDWIIGTHPHADHIGGFPDILSYAAQNSDLTISNVMIPQLPDDMIPTTRTYEKFLDGVDENGLILTQATDITIDLGSASLEIIPSPGNDYSSLNDYSICAYLTCGDTSFFFTGDASKPEEKDLLRSGALDGIQADVLKVGHFHRRFSGTAPAQLCSDLLRRREFLRASPQRGSGAFAAVLRRPDLAHRRKRHCHHTVRRRIADRFYRKVRDTYMIILDRLEETLAVLETDDGMVNVPRELLPADVREGDVLRQAADGTYTTDTAATQARREKLLARTRRMTGK
jgi:hypothetical protein